jgi:acylphosphatase
MTERLHVRVSGRVQGVGFRWEARARALELGLCGWVRNLPDGGVEAEFEGLTEALDVMEAWCRQGPRLALVSSVEATRETGAPKHSGFTVSG